jgi:isocitrate dehydrogenase kinase/phosphatase
MTVDKQLDARYWSGVADTADQPAVSAIEHQPMNQATLNKKLSKRGAITIRQAFDAYRRRFKEITRCAQSHFISRNWHAMRADAILRLALYKEAVDHIEDEIRQLLADRIQDKKIWHAIKTAYSTMLAGSNDWELAETFFNSVTRRIFSTVGVDSNIEFVNTDFDTPPGQTSSICFRTLQGQLPDAGLIKRILADYPWLTPFKNLEYDARQAADKIKTRLQKLGRSGKIDRIDIIRNVFYRGMGAYIVGRIFAGTIRIPLAIALLNLPDGIVIDGILLYEDDLSILFSFTHSHFHVEVDRPYDLIQFLKSILPQKRIAELHISIGFHKHGKTELYRELLEHLSVCYEDRFDISRGQRGMVMIVFNMPHDDLVFKLIKDKFDSPKKTTPREVMEKYDLVFRHDRAGRLVDAQAFEYLKFDGGCFSERLLGELKQGAANSVWIKGDSIIVNHAYVERRVTPLDIFLKEAKKAEGIRAVIDWGNSIKDLAVSNIFPGDILLKNFGVTRHGRVVFYDYDELCLLTTCNFRKLPPPSAYDDDMAAEPWFYVDENDVFPEELQNFIELSGSLKTEFLKHHADLFDVDFWQQTQDKVLAGELPHIFPYSNRCKIKRN